MFQAVIFDMDGLLIDSERAIMTAWIAASQSCGVQLTPEAYSAVVGLAEPETNAILSALLGSVHVFEQANAEVTRQLTSKQNSVLFPLKKGARDLVTKLRATDVRCAVASSSSLAEIRHRLHQVGLLELFSAIAGGDEVIRGKPDPAVYALAAERLGVVPSDCLVFEDSENGAAAALAAGASVVLIPDMRRPPASLCTRCMHVMESLEVALLHVPTWFKRSMPPYS